ncbi:MAG: high frequency lysogenization protein HflD [Gammaproteobacteria bacterium]|nr:high frequency lysogenization protein HflD [Gammaproteobacteria bacterium]
MANYRNITLALAGIFQSAQQVINLANSGQSDERIIEPLIASVLKLEAESCEDVYGHTSNLRPGLRLIDTQLRTGASGKSADLGRYVASLLNLERQLSRSAEMQSVIATRIIQVKRLTEDTELTDPAIIHSIAELYKDTISTLPLRIQVTGEQDILQQPDIQDKVRCCLFCGLRSAVLWRQMGGKRRQLILNRKQLINTAENLLLGR